jgi:pimeloyl-ACP methyl ester carboxylesterase
LSGTPPLHHEDGKPVELRSPVTELADVEAHHYPWLPVRMLSKDRFQVTEHLSDSEVPLTIIYGDRDSVVPTELSARVADEAPTLVERVVIPGANHNDEVMFGPPVADAVARLAKAVA